MRRHKKGTFNDGGRHPLTLHTLHHPVHIVLIIIGSPPSGDPPQSTWLTQRILLPSQNQEHHLVSLWLDPRSASDDIPLRSLLTCTSNLGSRSPFQETKLGHFGLYSLVVFATPRMKHLQPPYTSQGRQHKSAAVPWREENTTKSPWFSWATPLESTVSS